MPWGAPAVGGYGGWGFGIVDMIAGCGDGPGAAGGGVRKRGDQNRSPRTRDDPDHLGRVRDAKSGKLLVRRTGHFMMARTLYSTSSHRVRCYTSNFLSLIHLTIPGS